MVGATSDDPAVNLAKVRGAKTARLGRLRARGRAGRAEGLRRRPRRRPVRPRRRARGEGRRLHAGDARREVGPERVRLPARRAFGEKIEEFDPDFSKVLVRYNPDGDAAMNERQTAKLAPARRLAARATTASSSSSCSCPAEPAPARVGRRQRRTLRRRAPPWLMMDAILELRAGGVEADIWKIEGIDDRDACDEIAHLGSRTAAATMCRVSCSAGAPPMRRSMSGSAPAPASRATSASRSAARSSPTRVKAYAADPDGFDREAAVSSISRELPALHRRLRQRPRRGLKTWRQARRDVARGEPRR